VIFGRNPELCLERELDSLPWPKGKEAMFERWFIANRRCQETRLDFLKRWATGHMSAWREKCIRDSDRYGEVPFAHTEQFERWRAIAIGAARKVKVREQRADFIRRDGAELSPQSEARLYDFAMKEPVQLIARQSTSKGRQR
jgi:hypothetical protein